MNIIFFGNTRFSLIGAKIIHEKFPLSLVVTLPDRPNKKGRLTPNPLKTFAEENNIPYLLVDKITDETIAEIDNYKPDFLIVEDYGLILPQKLLDHPRYASLNIHHSLLPKYRGTSPAPAAILAGDRITGVTVIKMNERVDAGDILAQKKYEMNGSETTESLLEILNDMGGKIILPVIEGFPEGKMTPEKQDESKASMSRRMSKEDGRIDLQNPPSKEKLDRMIRAYFPWPTVWTIVRIKNKEVRIKLLPATVCHPERAKRIEGSHLKTRDSSPVAQNDIFCIQVEGGKPMSYKDFLNGYPELTDLIQKLGY